MSDLATEMLKITNPFTTKEKRSLYPQDWIDAGAPDIQVDSNLESNVNEWLAKEKEYKKVAKEFLSSKGVNVDLETFQEEFIALESELKLFSKNEDLPIIISSSKIPNTNSKYNSTLIAEIPEEIYPHFLQWVREMSKVELRKKGFKIPIEYKCIWNGKEEVGKVSIPAPNFRKLPKGLGVNSFGDVDMDDIERYGLDDDIQNMYNQVIGNWEEFSKYLGSLKPGEVPQKPTWMSDAQWAEMKAIAMKEAWDEQEVFNREMVKELPPEAGEVVWEQIKRNYLASKLKTEDAELTTSKKDYTDNEKVD